MSAEQELIPLEKLSATQLAEFVSQLIEKDFSQLLQLLYRLDVSEEKIKTVLVDNPGGDAGTMIAQLIMERMDQSRKSKELFKQQDDIPEDEKW